MEWKEAKCASAAWLALSLLLLWGNGCASSPPVIIEGGTLKAELVESEREGTPPSGLGCC